MLESLFDEVAGLDVFRGHRNRTLAWNELVFSKLCKDYESPTEVYLKPCLPSMIMPLVENS